MTFKWKIASSISYKTALNLIITMLQYVTKQIEKMENVLKNMKGDVAENKVYSALRKLWNGKRGILIHSFKPENVLAPLTKRAKPQRTTHKKWDEVRISN